MGIYIPGMDMPLACAPCPVKYWCGLWSKVTLPAHIRHPDCPLVEVPAHGRLVDADKLMGRIEQDTPLSSTFEKIVRRYIEDAPTVVPASEEGET